MRQAFIAAVCALLNDPRLVGALDVVRLAAVVLLAKAPATSSCVRVTYRDLAGWLGCTESHIGHTVIPSLRKAGVVTSELKRDLATGYPIAVELDLLPLRQARAAGGAHPLALLNQRDLATLLRLCEAVTCPGWAPVDKPETPAGFMAKRRGRHAATDRLAMVLLVLHARGNGRVRMAPGRVAKGFGRADATVARLLNCPVKAAVAVVDRLVKMDAVELGSAERDRLRVPAVAQAYARARKATAPTEAGDGGEGVEPPVTETGVCPNCAQAPAESDPELVLAGDGWAQESFDDVLEGQPESAFRDQDPSGSVSSQVSGGLEEDSAVDRAAEFHASHPPVAGLSGFSAGDDDCFSGSAVVGCGDQRGRAGASEDHGCSADGGLLGTGQSPLRGDKQRSSLSQLSSWAGASFVGAVAVPEDLREVLAPLARLWAGLGRVSTGRWLAHKVRSELGRLRGVVGHQHAEVALACRLRRRLERQGTRPVQDLAGWLMQRGLPQQAGCWSAVCDDGVRMDTGGPCESCGCLVGDRRGLRRAVAAEVVARYPRLSHEDRRPLYEQELHSRFQQQAAQQVARREQAARDRESREAAVQEQREQLAQERAEQAALSCRECGAPASAGLCMGCGYAKDTRKLVGEAVDIVLALRADLDDREAVASLAERVEEDTWTVVREVGADVAAGEPVARAHVEYERAQRLLAQRQRKALVALSKSSPAEAEANHVHRMVLHSVWPVTAKAREQAKERANQARMRVAHDLLAGSLSDLHRCRATVEPDRRPWSQRLAELLEQHQHPLPELAGAR
ncbi:hypothetical protein [Streptomyces noursei]|uniref:hypothetical protein n=1 Tax=Streptomyces noursei TaxID=1971 RepID=UPI001674E4A8|nr:hypothetical protein [Streptomyces noursei]MCZ1021414.1 hypothetical protein [Streptomyces noursei]GGX46297.1 hypothetical protein GCM10010341_80010 [Streptomyces noursei]